MMDKAKNAKRKPKQVLFLCTGNSCRSQLAEAVVNARLGETWQAYSAGVRPAGYVHPMAIVVLSEMGITHTGRSKSVDEFRDRSFDLVVTVCDQAAEECPLWLGSGKRLHLGFTDPARATGDETTRMQAFRQVAAAIAAQIPALLRQYE
jgi:arsenate reductase (thioredoxin)